MHENWPGMYEMLEIIKQELDRRTVFIDESKLGIDFIPDRLLHRDEEFKQLTQVYLPLIKLNHFISKNVLLTGNNGTGKTALSKRFGGSFEQIATNFNKSIKYIHINCRINRSNYNIIKKLLKSLKTDVPEKGYSIYELITLMKGLLDKNDIHVILALDEINYLNLKENNLVYILNRLNDDSLECNSRISIIGIEKNLTFIQNLDLSTISSFQYNIIALQPYTTDQIFDILAFRASLALKNESYTPDTLKFISKIAAKNGDMRYSLEILYKAGKYADQHNLATITPECIRHAQECTIENFDFNSLKMLTRNEKAVLLAISRGLSNLNASYIDINELKQNYSIICEEENLDVLKKTQFYIILNRLKELEYITITPPISKKQGHNSMISVDNIPVQVLEKELLKIL
jgi:archaeal cell division control protein 6